MMVETCQVKTVNLKYKKQEKKKEKREAHFGSEVGECDILMWSHGISWVEIHLRTVFSIDLFAYPLAEVHSAQIFVGESQKSRRSAFDIHGLKVWPTSGANFQTCETCNLFTIDQRMNEVSNFSRMLPAAVVCLWFSMANLVGATQ